MKQFNERNNKQRQLQMTTTKLQDPNFLADTFRMLWIDNVYEKSPSKYLEQEQNKNKL